MQQNAAESCSLKQLEYRVLRDPCKLESMTSEGTVQAPAPNPSNIPWENVLAELEGGGEGEAFKGLDRLASLDFVSDLLSSEGFENFKPPGHEERKLTRLASLELLTELFDWDGGLAEGQAAPLEGASGVSNDWTDEGLLAALGDTGEGAAHVIEGESTGGSGEGGKRSLESGWASEIGGQDGSPDFAPPSADQQLQWEAKMGKAPNAGSQAQAWKRSDAAYYALSARPPFQSAVSRRSSGTRQTASSGSRKIGRPMLPSTPPPLDMQDPLAGPRMRFTPQQQKALYDFGESIKWATPGLENDPRAQQMCELIGMGMRQLKKWISNHRPKEHKPPVSHPPWSIPAGLITDGSHPPLSRAALASLAAAQAAVMGQPFVGPFVPPPTVQGPFHPPAPGQWPQGIPPAAFVPPFGAGMQLPFGGVIGTVVDVPYQVNGPLSFGGGSGSSIGSQGSQNEGGLASEASMRGDTGLAVDNVKKVLRRKLKDFEPEKVRKLFDLCMEYRQKRSLLKAGGTLLEGLDPPTKRQRTEAPSPLPPVLAPPTPSSAPILSPNRRTFPSESGDDSELTECEKPLTDFNPLILEPVQILNPSEGKQTPLENGAPSQAVWDGSGGRTLSTLPSFPSIDLSHWGIEAGITSVNADQPAGTAGESQQLTSAMAGFANQSSQERQTPSHQVGAHSPQSIPELVNSFPNPSRNASGDFRPSFGGERRHSAGRMERTESQERKVTAELPGCTYLFEKALTISDTNPLGRIVMPKVQAEGHLPRMAGKESCTLTVTDADGKTWQLRYSVWLNNRSRMYVLEHAGDFLQSRGLAPGDLLAFYRADDRRLIILDKKQNDSPPAQPGSDGGAAASGSGARRLPSGHSGAFSAAEITDSQKVEVDPLLLHELKSF
ncbi:hypothetical protein KFL_001150030 [Klebsormidium nitens]|uniref:TF-B3 domain-containing protein n=1 Tax=Klebsormidium nitens TaxID=105231 RepID=A0A1Y1HXQ3_KLENI|nr:hypothetical protein KFL_001150030 [Klebsormidium nitens]|eukprot:GAQ82542.1 hypothetical protein KFL_001150030 [Klebsormidium nitens]